MKISFINATISKLTVQSNVIEIVEVLVQDNNDIIANGAVPVQGNNNVAIIGRLPITIHGGANAGIGMNAAPMIGELHFGGGNVEEGDNNTTILTNDADIETNVVPDLNEIEIKDNSRVTAKFGFSIDKISLLSGYLDFTYSGQAPCTSALHYTKGTKFILKSEAGFNMKIVYKHNEEEKEYCFLTDSKEVSSSFCDSLIKLINQIESCDGEYPIELLREYSNLIKQDFTYDLLKSNIDVKKIESCVIDNFFEIALIAKNLNGSYFTNLPTELLNHISSYLKLSDIKLLGSSDQEEIVECLIDDINS
ncbi:MAG: hypothetical protein EKK61_02100 [Rickettsiales bacterium]|nr:MAG: hypothetical protein EKK61_02100 [Rickettsiales bacterium]